VLVVKDLASLRLLRAVQGGDAVFGVDYERAHANLLAAVAVIGFIAPVTGTSKSNLRGKNLIFSVA
jgi:hypothetical protein